MRKARDMENKMRGKSSLKKVDEDEKIVNKHLSHDIEESKKSFHDDKKLKKTLKRMD